MNQAAFESNLEKLKKKNPAHDVIVVLQERGYDHLSVEYLKLALAEPVEISEVSAARLYKQKDTLYSRRAVLSNKFHDCSNDKERAEVSIAIGSIQTEIIANRAAIGVYIETGKVPKTPDRLVLPYDGRRKEKRLHSVRTSISRYRGLLRSEKDPDKIKYYEDCIIKLDETAVELSA